MSSLLAFIVWLSLVMYTIGLFLALFRLMRGPTLADRVVALDVIGLLAVGMIAVHSVKFDNPLYLRVATVFALIAFLGTVAFAYYVEKRGIP